MNRFRFLYARLNLAAQVMVHFVRRALSSFRKGRVEERSFLAMYREDGFFPVTQEERDVLQTFSRCISCGLCVTQCVDMDMKFFSEFMTPYAAASSLSRAPQMLWSVGRFLPHCEGCRQCEVVCPTYVPLHRIFNFMKERHKTLRGEHPW